MGKVRKVTKRGNSPGVNLPGDALDDLGLSLGDHVDIAATGDRIVIRPLQVAGRTTDGEQS